MVRAVLRSVGKIGGKRRHSGDACGLVRKVAPQSRGAAAAKILVKRGFIPHLLFKAPDMCEKPLLRAGEQRFQIGQRGGADMLDRKSVV